MKFSDMMGKGDPDAATEVADAESSAKAPALPPPVETRGAPTVPGSDIRFGGVPAAPPVPSVAPVGPAPSISDVVAELAPRPPSAVPNAPAATVVTDQQLDTSSWIDGINEIDDDLLPK